jgi:hypothetical protein
MEFEDFWNPPQPPDEGGDNNRIDDLTSSDLPPSGTGGTGWYENTQIAETTQNQGGQGGTGVQGIGSHLEKNKISVLDKPFLEKPTEQKLTSVFEGGQGECRVDSCNVTQDKPNYETYPHLTCDNIDAKRNQAEDIKGRLLKAQTKQDLTLIREQYSNCCDWVWKNLLTKVERRMLKEMASIEQLDLFSATSSPASSNLEAVCLDNPANLVVVEPVFQKRDRVMTPQGEAEILRFNEHFGEYSVAFAFGTQYFKPEELTLIVGATPNSASADYETEDDEIEEEF